MEEQEYKKFLSHLFNEGVSVRQHRHRHFHEEDDFYYRLHEMIHAMPVINYINRYCRELDDSGIYRTFTLGKLRSTVTAVEQGIAFHNRVAREGGYLSVVDDNFEEIVDGIKSEHLPSEDFLLLRELGSKDPDQEMAAIIYLLKSRKMKYVNYTQEVRISRQLEQLQERLSKDRDLFQEIKEGENNNIKPPKRPGRRWFKALGHICRGAAISVANIALASELLPLPVSPETKTWGSIVSVTTGIGDILNGIGELRNE